MALDQFQFFCRFALNLLLPISQATGGFCHCPGDINVRMRKVLGKARKRGVVLSVCFSSEIGLVFYGCRNVLGCLAVMLILQSATKFMQILC